MRSGFAARDGFTLLKTPSYRQQSGRRWALVVCGVLALAMTSGLIGSLSAPTPSSLAARPVTGPFSYIPSE